MKSELFSCLFDNILNLINSIILSIVGIFYFVGEVRVQISYNYNNWKTNKTILQKNGNFHTDDQFCFFVIIKKIIAVVA